MTIDTEHLWEKLYPAAWKLARSADPIHDRIGEAFRAIRDLKGEEFGPEERLIYNEITARMTKAGPVVENGAVKTGAVANTLADMPEGEACEIAESIFELFVQVAELHFKN
ncbi:hypothetical protein [Polymorphobacter fuscus]|uniref:Uncharacterized protein n=1 Tax=Sandarakinorhabdus fusca TaxID=1439888 RepID=A0A7C9KXY7_9SPHN|nr:hypothetical protein [Polymorphobacter fuscus]KAB7648741.1 hypothetical protein F9290_03430 [Polymorphobacter fuscus]MQT16308.1 hypothetical protein [Polymorphobacter fuscus]NJC07405.1 hypothetical protein [Polymorphobacter fuscus]